MNWKTHITLSLTAIALLLAGWLAGASGNTVAAQSPTQLDEPYEWRMFGGNVAGTGGGGGSELVSGSPGRAVTSATWLYNMKTGKVYRVWEGCNEDDGGTSGCLFAVPVFSGDRLSQYRPNPLTVEPPGLEM